MNGTLTLDTVNQPSIPSSTPTKASKLAEAEKDIRSCVTYIAPEEPFGQNPTTFLSTL